MITTISQEVENTEEQVLYIRDIEEDKKDARLFLKRFFDGKPDRHGNRIDVKTTKFRRDFLTEENIELVTETTMFEGIHKFYQILKCPIAGGDAITPDIRYFLKATQECSRLGIPKSRAAGVCCVHAKHIGTWSGIGTDIFYEEGDDNPLSDGCTLFSRRFFEAMGIA